ncbi:hypothetical protein [Christensenella minuta]|uniref:hypothetical protein n=1 Tax=Christensenella minuta TaxID=626937 RepID=UPI0021582288|nr:hypothetical protein [Christensenella minuta]
MKNDLISRKAIKEYINQSDLTNREKMTLHIAISNIPSTAAAPEVHGRWGEIYDPYGELEEWIHGECGRCSKEKSPYCPNCGARMDGGEEE